MEGGKPENAEEKCQRKVRTNCNPNQLDTENKCLGGGDGRLFIVTRAAQNEKASTRVVLVCDIEEQESSFTPRFHFCGFPEHHRGGGKKNGKNQHDYCSLRNLNYGPKGKDLQRLESIPFEKKSKGKAMEQALQTVDVQVQNTQ